MLCNGLRIGYEGLKKRPERGADPARPSEVATQFVEKFAPPAFSTALMLECIVEMESARVGNLAATEMVLCTRKFTTDIHQIGDVVKSWPI